jgi:hypothetical protein
MDSTKTLTERRSSFSFSGYNSSFKEEYHEASSFSIEMLWNKFEYMEAKTRQNGFNVDTYRAAKLILLLWIQVLQVPEICIEVTSRAAYFLHDVCARVLILIIVHLSLITL